MDIDKRKEAAEVIRNHATDYLQKARVKGYICPVCGSGSGNSGTGITTKDGIYFTCWAGCYTHADIIDIIGIQYSIDSFPAKLDRAMELFHITDTSIHNYVYTNTHTQQEKKPEEEAETDYTEFLLQANKNLCNTDYHRGISIETLNRYKVGYVEKWKHPKAMNAPESPRLIIPTSGYSYLARDTRSNLTEEQKQYSKSKVGKVRLFNSRALYESTAPVFIVEGELDALSIIDCGGEAVALGSISYVEMLYRLLQEKRPQQPLLLAMDNDPRGQGVISAMAARLNEMNIPYRIVEPYGQYKDANEAMNADKEAFKELIKHMEQIYRAETEKEEQTQETDKAKAEREKLEEQAAAYSLQEFINAIAERKQRGNCIKTGFTFLDNALDGGLYTGLYCIGAISSLGKTTFCLQLADNIAASGKPVLYYSLEMDSEDLIAKSISRLSYEISKERYGNTSIARSFLQVKRGDIEQDVITEAIGRYQQYATRLWIMTSNQPIGVNRIVRDVERIEKAMGETPVIVIDFLQLLAADDPRSTDKQNMDKAMLALKTICRAHKATVIAISSFNRENYTAPVNLSSFKESGAIEYTADVLIGLQYDGMDYVDGELDGARLKRVRELQKEQERLGRNGEAQKVQVKILKNRNAAKANCVLDLVPRYSIYMDVKGEVPEEWVKVEPRRRKR